MPSAFLPERGVVRVTGPDARRFLDNLLTSDIGEVGYEKARYAALLTPQGKVLFDMIVSEAEEPWGGGFLLDCSRALAPELAKRLGFYKLRANVEIADISDSAGVVVYWSDAIVPEEDGVTFADPRLPALGTRMITNREHAKDLGGVDGEAWHEHRIALGVPETGRDFVAGDVFPHEIDMDQLGGVDFTKGCYVGQEVVSRMEHRGTARTRIIPVRFKEGFAPLDGCEAFAGGKSAGRIGSGAPGGLALALLRLDRIDDALKGGERLTAGGMEFEPVKPDWARFPFPGEGGAAIPEA